MLNDGRSLQITAVPHEADITASFLQAVLPQMRYTAMALRYSRALLARLLLSSSSSSLNRKSREECEPKVSSQPPTASLLLDENANPIEKYLISDWKTVVDSYEKTIQLLIGENNHDLACQAYRELGLIFLMVDKKMACLSVWSNALDLLFRNLFVQPVSEVINHLDQVFLNRKSDYDLEMDLINSIGAWGCCFGAVLLVESSNLMASVDSSPSTEEKRRLCHFGSGHMLRALLRAAITHPREDHEYSSYELSKDSKLVPGVLLANASDLYRFNIQHIIQAIEQTVQYLISERCLLFTLPIVAVYQYLSTWICRSTEHCVKSRLFRIRVLTDLKFFKTSHHFLLRLLNGYDLPLICSRGFRQPAEGKQAHPELDLSRPLNDVKNIPAIEALLSRRLPNQICEEIGAFLSCEISVAHARLMVSISKSVPGLPDFSAVDQVQNRYTQRTFNTKRAKAIEKEFAFFYNSRAKYDGQRKLRVRNPNELFDLMRQLAMAGTSSSQSDEVRPQGKVEQEKRWLPDDATSSISKLKGSILMVAEQILALNSELLLDAAACTPDGIAGLSWREASLVINARKEQARISRLRQHGFLAARTALDAMDLMMLWQGKHSHPGLECRQWVELRLSLIRGLAMRISGIGKFDDIPVERNFSSSLKYCEEGIEECKRFNLPLMEAQFHYMKAKLLYLDSSAKLADIVDSLDRTIEITKSPICKSELSEILKAKSQLLKLDILAVLPGGKNEDVFPDPQILAVVIEQYAPMLVNYLNVLNRFGIATEINKRNIMLSTVSANKSELKWNSYFKYKSLVIEVKYRFCCWTLQNRLGTVLEPELIADLISLLRNSISLNKQLINRDLNLEVELTYLMATLKRLTINNFDDKSLQFPPFEIFGNYLSAVELSKKGCHDLRLVKNCFLDLTNLALSCEKMVPKYKNSSAKKGQRIKDGGKHETADNQLLQDLLFNVKESQAFGVILASKTAASQRNRLILPAERAVSEKRFSGDVNFIPDYVTADIFALYTIAKRQYKDWVEEELATLDNQINQGRPESYDLQLDKILKAAQVQLAAVHLLNYETVLERLCSFSAMVAARSPQQCRGGLVIRKPLISQPWQERLSHFRQCLLQLIPNYVLSPALETEMFKGTIEGFIELAKKEEFGAKIEMMVGTIEYPDYLQTKGTSVIENLVNGYWIKNMGDGLNVAEPVAELTAEQMVASAKLPRSGRRSSVQANDSEIILQWYRDIFQDDLAHNNKGHAIYATHKSGLRSSLGRQQRAYVGKRQINWEELKSIHAQLVELNRQVALVQAGSNDKEPSSARSNSKSPNRKSRHHQGKNVSLGARVEASFNQVLVEVRHVLSGEKTNDHDDCESIEISKTNLGTLEKIFDPTYGIILRGQNKIISWFLAMLSNS